MTYLTARKQPSVELELAQVEPGAADQQPVLVSAVSNHARQRSRVQQRAVDVEGHMRRVCSNAYENKIIVHAF